MGTHHNELKEMSVKQAQHRRLGSMWNRFVIIFELGYFDAAISRPISSAIALPASSSIFLAIQAIDRWNRTIFDCVAHI